MLSSRQPSSPARQHPGPFPFAWRRMWPLGLVALTIMVIAGSSTLPSWPGLVHLVGLPPIDLYADFRLIVVHSPSWPMAGFALLIALTLRITLLAYLMGGLTSANLAFATRFYAVVTVPMFIAALSVTVASTMPNARFFWGGFGIFVITTVVMAALPWQGTTRLRLAFTRNWTRGLRLEVLLVYFVAITAIGALAVLVPADSLWFVPLSAAATALALRGFSRRPVRRPYLLTTGVVTAFALCAIVFVATRGQTPTVQEPVARPGSLMIMGGIVTYSGGGVMMETDPQPLGYTCDQLHYYSYAGPGDGQPQGSAVCPITTGAPYSPEDTQRPLDEQIEVFAEQTQDLPRPLVVAGHSHAIWVAWEALVRGEAEVDALMLLGPLPDSPIGYPSPGENGQGRVLADVLRVGAIVAELREFEFDPDSPAAHQLQAVPNSSRAILEQDLPDDVRVLSVPGAADLPLMPGGWQLDVERNVCPIRTPHPQLPVSEEYTEEFIRFFDDQPGLECPVWRDWGAYLAQPFTAAPSS